MKIINLLGGSNTGKSTAALGLAFFMKAAGMRVELAPEYAKVMAYEKRSNILGDQLYMLAKQNRTLARLKNMDWVVTDSSLLLGNVYKSDEPELFDEMVRAYFDRYDNICFYLPRNRSFVFEKEGRVQQSHDEAAELDERIQYELPVGAITLDVDGDTYVRQMWRHLGFDEALLTQV